MARSSTKRDVAPSRIAAGCASLLLTLALALLVPDGTRAGSLLDPPMLASRSGTLDVLIVARPQLLPFTGQPAGYAYEVCLRPGDPAARRCPVAGTSVDLHKCPTANDPAASPYGGARLQITPGQTLRIRLVNCLPPAVDAKHADEDPLLKSNPTNLHTHGLIVEPHRADDARDPFGDYIFVLDLPDGIQPPASTPMHGGSDHARDYDFRKEVVDYEIPIDVSHPPGLFWFHPHVHGLSLNQVTGGLAGIVTVGDVGAYICDHGTTCAPGQLQPNVRHLVFKDVEITSDFRVRFQENPAICATPDAPGNIGGCTGANTQAGTSTDANDGRWEFTVNGQTYPETTAVVSGVAALLLSVARSENYRLGALDIRRILIDSAVPCELEGEGASDRYLAGSLDASAALTMLRQIGTTTHSPISLPATPLQSGLVGCGGNGEGEPLAIGSSEMSNSTPEQSDPTPVEALGLSPSACECESKAEDEPEKAVFKPQSSSPMLLSSPTTQFIAQSGISAGVNQLACSCGAAQPPQIVYALGALWFDFGTEARYDALVQQLGDPVRANTPSELFSFLGENLHFASGLTFILMQDQIPLYAVQPGGPFALEIYRAMLDALTSSIDSAGSEQRVSVPGYIVGATRLMNGMAVPVVYPDLRGMYKWRPEDLVSATRQVVPADEASDDEILNFLNRVYYELRNLGVAPQERAINFAATNAYQARAAFADSTARRHALDSIKVVKSPICRPDSDCWDVQLQMFDPENERRAGRIYRYTVDVSEVLPVTVGPIRQWAARLGTF